MTTQTTGTSGWDADKTQALIDVENLTVLYQARGIEKKAVSNVSLSIGKGEVLAIVGESGSGKSTIVNALLGLLPHSAKISEGKIKIDKHEIASASNLTKSKLRGKFISLVPQDPMTSLNPSLKIGTQIGEAFIHANGWVDRSTVELKVNSLLEKVGIDQPAIRAQQYPHQLSGGMRQRVLIAIAMAGEPAVIIADEPTSALDVTVQRKILNHLEHLVKGKGISLLIVTHDLGVAADRADRIIVMKDGSVVEQGTKEQIITAPRHSYTKKLIGLSPSLNPILAKAAGNGNPLLELEGIKKSYITQSSKLDILKNISLSVSPGETVAIVGESGSGKSTILRLAMGLEQPDAGSIKILGTEVTNFTWGRFRPLRRDIQLVQQNTGASLNPRMTIYESVIEPLRAFEKLQKRELATRAKSLMQMVQLPIELLNRFPAELSGGQRQRVIIARALSLHPKLLLLDEPVSALDVSVQSEIVALLKTLQEHLGVGYLFISHDLAVVSNIAHRIVVLSKGEIVEFGNALDIFQSPQHEYTQELLDAIPGKQWHMNVSNDEDNHVNLERMTVLV